jgi:choline dehydrogenase-like flavoprotein
VPAHPHAPVLCRDVQWSAPGGTVIGHIGDIGAGPLRGDICIVGAGAAGITIARELDGSDLRVLLLEGGGRRVDERTQALYGSDVTGLAHDGIHSMRFRVFGGTTTRWPGEVLPLFDIDFERRDWVPNSGWPLGRDELEPYYRRASDSLSVPPFPRRLGEAWPSALAPSPRFDQQLVTPFFSEHAPQPDFARAYGRRLAHSENVEVLLAANVVELVPDQATTYVQAARARSLDGSEVKVEADLFVVCCGGIDSARLLLASDRHSEGGLGNSRDLVGRFFQDHPGFRVGPIISSGDGLRETFSPQRVRGVKLQPRFAASEELQQRERLLGSCGEVLFDAPGGRTSVAGPRSVVTSSDSIEAGKSLAQAIRRREMPHDLTSSLRAIVRDPAPLVRAGARYFVLRRPAIDTSGTPVLTIGCEQAPKPESRVYLSENRDELGMRRAVLDWRLSEQEIQACRRFAGVVASEFERLGLGEVDLDAFKLPDDPDELSGLVVDRGHHMGTTRMASDSKTGVVDSGCKVFGLDNLYLGNCGVFPTSGSTNPTFTLIALCIRIADTLRQRAQT